jgi:hypothetical protein
MFYEKSVGHHIGDQKNGKGGLVPGANAPADLGHLHQGA